MRLALGAAARRVLDSTSAGRLLDSSTQFLLPAWCAGCDGRLPWRPSPLGLCADCRRHLPEAPSHRCRGCGAAAPVPGGVPPHGALPRGASPPRAGRTLCVACERRPPAFDGLLAAWSYQPPIDEVIRRLKYGRLEFLADDLAAGIAAAILAQASRHDWVTAVPLHWRRRLERGYDQAALLARAVAGTTGVPYRPFLIRARSTPPQVARSAAGRRGNVEDAFRCRYRGARALIDSSVLLVDDVATTGATLDAASRALKAAGAARVIAAVAALTPPGT